MTSTASRSARPMSRAWPQTALIAGLGALVAAAGIWGVLVPRHGHVGGGAAIAGGTVTVVDAAVEQMASHQAMPAGMMPDPLGPSERRVAVNLLVAADPAGPGVRFEPPAITVPEPGRLETVDTVAQTVPPGARLRAQVTIVVPAGAGHHELRWHGATEPLDVRWEPGPPAHEH